MIHPRPSARRSSGALAGRRPRATQRRAAAGAAAALTSAVALLALLPGIAMPAAAQRVPPDNVLRDFQRTGDYVLVIDGKRVPAEIYQSQRAAAMLVISSSFPSPVLLSPSTGMAQTVNLMKVEKKPDGSIDLLSDAALAPQGAIDIRDDEVHFKADGISAVLAMAPPLLGLHRADEVTAHNPEYLPRAMKYHANPSAVAQLKKEQRPVTVRVFYGSWCPHCREMVPHAIRLEQALKGTHVRFEYFGLPNGFGKEPVAQQNQIKAVPTGIVYAGGKEIGRITSNGWLSPETTLIAILSGKAPPEG